MNTITIYCSDMYFIRKLKQPCLENKKNVCHLIFLDFSTVLYFILLYHSVMYVTFTKAKKHRVLSYKEIFELHRYFTLNIASLAYLIFIFNCMH